MAFLDTDELLAVKNESLGVLDVLEENKHYGGIALNWMLFGSSGHVHRPIGGVLASYRECTMYSHVKSIVNMQHVQSISSELNPHFFRYKRGYYAVNTDHIRIDGPFSPPPIVLRKGPHRWADPRYERLVPPPASLFSKIHINHYVLKSWIEFEEKMLRGGPSVRGKQRFAGKTSAFFNLTNAEMNQICDVLKPRTTTIATTTIAAET